MALFLCFSLMREGNFHFLKIVASCKIPGNTRRKSRVGTHSAHAQRACESKRAWGWRRIKKAEAIARGILIRIRSGLLLLFSRLVTKFMNTDTGLAAGYLFCCYRVSYSVFLGEVF
jgi:hypothetical protein